MPDDALILAIAHVLGLYAFAVQLNILHGYWLDIKKAQKESAAFMKKWTPEERARYQKD